VGGAKAKNTVEFPVSCAKPTGKIFFKPMYRWKTILRIGTFGISAQHSPPDINNRRGNSKAVNGPEIHFIHAIRRKPASVTQLAETQCAPTGTVCRRSRGSIPRVDR